MLAFVLIALCQAEPAPEPPPNVLIWIEAVKKTHLSRIAKVERDLEVDKKKLANMPGGKERRAAAAKIKETEKDIKELKKRPPDPTLAKMPVPPKLGSIGRVEIGRFRQGHIEIGGTLMAATGQPLVSYSRAIVRDMDTSKYVENEQIRLGKVYEIVDVEKVGGEQIPVYKEFDIAKWVDAIEKRWP